MLYSLLAFVASLVLNGALAYVYNKGSLLGGIALVSSVVGLGVTGAVLAFSQRGKPVGQLGAGLFTGSVSTAALCAVTLGWIILYMRGDI